MQRLYGDLPVSEHRPVIRIITFGFSILFLVIATFFLMSRNPASFAHDSSASTTALDAQWEREYDGISVEQIRAEVEMLNLYLAEHTQIYYDAQFEAGNYEIVEPVLSDASRVGFKVGDELAAWRVLPGGVIAKVTLPAQGFEEAYVIRSKIAFLMEKERQVQEFVALQEKSSPTQD